MRSISQILIALSYLLVACVIVCAGQVEEGVGGHVFRSDEVGFNYSFPEKFSAKVENEIRPQDPSGREHVILALWNTPERTGVPRMAFLYDKKVRQAGLSREEMADRYLAEVRQLWVNVKGVKISGPKQISPAGYPIWRLDLWQPDTLPHYNAAIAIPLADRRILVIQVNAPSQSELDEEVDSLHDLRFDWH
jgi:hypothetical protein